MADKDTEKTGVPILDDASIPESEKDILREKYNNKSEGLKGLTKIHGDEALQIGARGVKRVLTPDNQIEEVFVEDYHQIMHYAIGFNEDFGGEALGKLRLPTPSGETTIAHILVAGGDIKNLRFFCDDSSPMDLSEMFDSKGRSPAFALFSKYNIDAGFFDPKNSNHDQMKNMLNVLDLRGVDFKHKDDDGKTVLDVAKESLSKEQFAYFKIEYNKHVEGQEKEKGKATSSIDPIDPTMLAAMARAAEVRSPAA